MDDILIDRLVLDLPGLSPAQAEELARGIASALASAAPGPGSFDAVSLDLNEPATAANLPRLATQIAHSLLQQIG